MVQSGLLKGLRCLSVFQVGIKGPQELLLILNMQQ